MNRQRRTILAAGICLSSLASVAFATGQSATVFLEQDDWIEGVLRKHMPNLPKALPMLKAFSAQLRKEAAQDMVDLKSNNDLEIFVLVQFATKTNYLQWQAGEVAELKSL